MPSKPQPNAALAPLSAVSGEDCVRVFEGLGLVRCEEVAGAVWMECGANFVVVPTCRVVPIETLVDLLDATGISAQAFLERLDSSSLELIVA